MVPFQRALADNGVRLGASALVEACGESPTLETLAAFARRLGLRASRKDLGAGDLVFVPRGALVALEGGAIVTVVAHHPGGVDVEHSDGTTERLDATSAAIPRSVLELCGATAEGSRFFARLRARLGREPHFVRAIALSAAFAFVLLALALAGPVVAREALGAALPDRARNELALLAFATFLVGAQLTYVSWLRRRAQLYLATKLSEVAALDVVEHMLALPFATLQRIGVGRAQQAAASATSAGESLPGLVEQLVDAILGLGFLGFAFAIDPKSGALAGAAGAVLVVAGLVVGRRRVALRRVLLARSEGQKQALFETIAGIETVKSESIEGPMLERWLERLLGEEETALALRLLDSRFGVLQETVERVVFASVLLAMAHRCLTTNAPVSDLVATVLASASFVGSMGKLARLPPSLSTLSSDTERANEVLTLEGERASGRGGPLVPDAPAVVLRDVWFRYDESSPWVLRGMDLTVAAGETVQLSWPSGAGKSTLLRVLSGLLAPSRGDALVFGLDARRARKLVTYVPQEASLFPASVLENLRILSRGASYERIMEAAEATGLSDVVAGWPMGFETMISLGAFNVSSGQRQLVLFTAAVASETLLVLLDEALAHVDLARRTRLGGGSLFAGRTVIAVVHDASPREVARTRQVVASPLLVTP
jgi:ABC-type bacteriocin/lantibiotic exporter with double-glycine peptidase domain